MDFSGAEEDLFNYWNSEPLEHHPATKKLAYRVIGGYKFQFRLVDYDLQTTLLIDTLSTAKDLVGLLGDIYSTEETYVVEEPVNPEEQDDTSIAKAAAAAAAKAAEDDKIAFKLLPKIIAAIAVPGMQKLLTDLCATVEVDRGNAKFESLSDKLVAQEIFGKDLTLQIPVAVTAAMFNFGTVLSAGKNFL